MSEPDRTVEEARARFVASQNRLKLAKGAYLRGTLFEGAEVSFDRLKAIAEDMIAANHDLQLKTYGKIRLKLSVAKLLRRGR